MNENILQSEDSDGLLLNSSLSSVALPSIFPPSLLSSLVVRKIIGRLNTSKSINVSLRNEYLQPQVPAPSVTSTRVITSRLRREWEGGQGR